MRGTKRKAIQGWPRTTVFIANRQPMLSAELIFEPTLFASRFVLLFIAGYSVMTVVAVWLWRARRSAAATTQQAVSILKPLHGDEAELFENLRSFCVQDYPDYQVVFGVQDEHDPALRIVARLQRELPQCDIDCVIDPTQHGSNRKISNLVNIYRQARHDWLVLADSDIRVGRGYLQQVTAPLAQPRTGLVTCAYHGRPRGNFWARMGALFINGWFTPAVLVSHLFGARDFVAGATIALRRDTLEAIGGFKALSNHLADDYRLGERVRGLGLHIVLSNYPLETSVTETRGSELLRHELRWFRTIRSVQPLGYLLMFPTFGLPLVLLASLAPDIRATALPLLLVTLAARLLLHFSTMDRATSWWMTILLVPLAPLRDILNMAVWVAGFGSRRVNWAGHDFVVAEDGTFHAAHEIPLPQTAGESACINHSYRDREHDH